MALEKRPKRTIRASSMKQMTTRTKRQIPSSKPKDYISETISFVIKGKLTPIKSASAKMAKKPIVKKKELLPKSKVIVKKSIIRKVKCVKKPETPKEASKATASTSPKKPPAKPIKKAKSEVAELKKKTTKKETKQTKTPQKADAIDKDKLAKDTRESPEQDIKTKQTIEKLLKQANRALKPVKPNPKKKYIKVNKTPVKAKSPDKAAKPQGKDKTQVKRKIAVANHDDTSASDDLTLNELRQSVGIKTEPGTNADALSKKIKKEALDDKPKVKKPVKKANLVVNKKRVLTSKDKVKRKENAVKPRKMKLLSFWNGPKRHRVASLNALAKVHCLYENETRGSALLDTQEKAPTPSPPEPKTEDSDDLVPCTRTLRSVPGLRAIGKHWDMHETSSSSEDNSSSESTSDQEVKPKRKIKKELSAISKKRKPKVMAKRRRNSELMMDLKDMVVRKRMASLNASAILAASYSVEKRINTSSKSESELDSSDYFVTDNEDEEEEVKPKFDADKVKKEEDGRLIEVQATPNKKVAVILNQDTDVTITGVYVNSTTRSTHHHEGFCRIAGMQYMISATSHTQTAATAVATETLLQSSSNSVQENSNSDSLPSCKSYTPLDALSNMQPPPGPGIQHGVPHQQMGPPPHVLPLPPHQLSPSRRHGCSSAFTSPHAAQYHHPPPPPLPGDPGYVHGYYQPAGPLISVPHGHTQQPPITKSAPLSDASPTLAASPLHQPPPAPSSHNGDSSDSEVIITSVTAGKETAPPPPPPPAGAYRYSQYAPAAPPGYSYSYPSHYYPTPAPAPSYGHHDMCYSSPYLHHKYPPTTFRRYLPSTQYYAPPNPPDLYGAPPTAPGGPNQSQQVVTATPVSASGSTYQAPPPPAIMEPYPPPPTLVETYPHPGHYYPGYGPAPPPSCYTHTTPSRTLPFINATYQSCPCPMQSCPKNVHTGPLTGDSKRSNISSIAKDSVPLPPVALALPLEPASATGPPSPARGSAGMPPPPSPAGATYQPPPPPAKQEECNPVEKKRKARVGKAMVRNMAATQNTMLLMCNPTNNHQRNYSGEVKREIESPKEKVTEAKKEVCSDEEEAKNAVAPERIPEPQNLKQEEEIKKTQTQVSEEDKIEEEETLPCVKTVAEIVKMKNMKRKSSMANEAEAEPAKKVKVEAPNARYANGSYKDLIKKDTTTVKIINGKRKLIVTHGRRMVKSRKQTKRKLTAKELDATPNKRLKQSKPLTASNKQNSKHAPKEKDKINSEQENKAPLKKTNKKATNAKSKKTAPAILDSLIAKNTIDRTIDNVVGEPIVRTNSKDASAVKTSVKEAAKKSTNKNGQLKINNKVAECRKSVMNRRKSKCKEKEAAVPQAVAKVPRRSLQAPRWSNGWMWEGEPYDGKVFLNSDETTVVRRCYPAMRHEEGDIIEARDCVLLKAGPRKNDLPFVAKIAYLWENPDDGEMMMSLLWYYRPEHTEQGRLPADQPDEVFASRHKDSNSVACIDDKCYVLTFHEYCRYRKDLRRLEECLESTLPCIPNPEPYPRCKRQPPSPLQVSPDMVFFCRRVYDFRQKRIVKNPS